MYSNIGKKYPLEWASTILAILSLGVTLPIYYFYSHGPAIRKRSKFASRIAEEREKGGRMGGEKMNGNGDGGEAGTGAVTGEEKHVNGHEA